MSDPERLERYFDEFGRRLSTATRSRPRRRARRIGLAVTVGVTAGGAALAQSQGRSLDSISVLKSGRPAELSETERGMLRSEQAFYELDLSRGRVAFDHSRGDGANGAGLNGRWIVVPGDEGVCLVTGDDSMTCARTETVADGKMAMSTLPMPKEAAVPGHPPALGSGAGKFQGIAPDDVTHVIGLNDGGQEIARTEVYNNVYELDLASFRELAHIGLVRGDGEITAKLPYGPNR